MSIQFSENLSLRKRITSIALLGMVQLNEGAQQIVESLRQSSSSIERLKDAARDLQKGVSRFNVG